ncbi:hypothetical protein PV11_02702 [Exophiala sideris]|uniref:Uncharacterized protein n=1 Tax=Exophiala sideris TaxID=1016849 RepID=A0A0D1Z019_9EURO|nr:hypothetical protein PV11_02702 [Exophiala sideris]
MSEGGRARALASQPTGRNSTSGEALRSNRQRPKCTHPSCGKFGHYVDNCWKAHPELRPRQAWGRGRGRRGRGGLNQQGTRSAFGGTQAVNEWPVEPGDWSVSPSTPPFRLFDLPQEIQNKIYKHLYAEKYRASVLVADNRDYVREYRQHGLRKKFYFNTTNYSVELACKKLRNDTHLLRKDAFNGHVQIKYHESYDWEALEKLCSGSFVWLRTRVTCIEMAGLNGRSIGGNLFDASTWEQLELLKHFPQVRTIEIYYDITKYNYRDEMETTEWKRLQEPGSEQAFLNGWRDNEFMYPATRLGVHGLMGYMELNSHECTIYMNVHVQWMSDRYYRVYEESVKFLVTSDGMEAVERH